MKPLRGCICSAVLALWHLPGNSLEHIEGVARRLPAQTEVYREIHSSDAHSQRIEYRMPDGSLIAEQHLDYTCSQNAPAFEQHDLRDGTRSGARWENGVYTLLHNSQTRALAQPDRLVASSGFNRFVQAEWETLLGGKRIDFDFALPARMQAFRLRIQRMNPPRSYPQTHVWFRISAAKAWLRPFVAPILLGYDDQKRLRIYRGLSNLEDSDGSALNVEISYRYDANPYAPEDSALARNEPIATRLRTPDSADCGEHRS